MKTAPSRMELWAALAPRLAPVQKRLAVVPQLVSRWDNLYHSWKLPDKGHPWSLTDEEGLAVYDLITHNRLRVGYEVATAFGYSGIYAALAMEQTGGHLDTLDCYVEEWKDSAAYDSADLAAAVEKARAAEASGNPPSGLRTARANAEVAGVTDQLTFNIGVSPADVPTLLRGKEVDYAYIDGGHDGDQPLQDWRAVQPFLAPRCAIVFHDNFRGVPVARAIEDAERYFGHSAHVLNSLWHLTVIGRGLEADTFRRLDRLCVRNSFGASRWMIDAGRAVRVLRRRLAAWRGS